MTSTNCLVCKKDNLLVLPRENLTGTFIHHCESCRASHLKLHVSEIKSSLSSDMPRVLVIEILNLIDGLSNDQIYEFVTVGSYAYDIAKVDKLLAIGI